MKGEKSLVSLPMTMSSLVVALLLLLLCGKWQIKPFALTSVSRRAKEAPQK